MPNNAGVYLSKRWSHQDGFANGSMWRYRISRIVPGKNGCRRNTPGFPRDIWYFYRRVLLKHYSNIPRVYDSGKRRYRTAPESDGSVTPHRSPGGALFPSAVDRRRGPKGPPRDDIRPPAIRRVALKRSTKNAHGGGVHDVCDIWLLSRARPRHRRCNSRKGSRPRVPRDYRSGVAVAAAEIKLR